MIEVPCHTCTKRKRCSASNEMHRKALSAWANNTDVPTCAFYCQAWWRGVDGVIDHSLTPSPSELLKGF